MGSSPEGSIECRPGASFTAPNWPRLLESDVVGPPRQVLFSHEDARGSSSPGAHFQEVASSGWFGDDALKAATGLAHRLNFSSEGAAACSSAGADAPTAVYAPLSARDALDNQKRLSELALQLAETESANPGSSSMPTNIGCTNESSGVFPVPTAQKRRRRSAKDLVDGRSRVRKSSQRLAESECPSPCFDAALAPLAQQRPPRLSAEDAAHMRKKIRKSTRKVGEKERRTSAEQQRSWLPAGDAVHERKKIRKSTQKVGEKEGRTSVEHQRPRLSADDAARGRKKIRKSTQNVGEKEFQTSAEHQRPHLFAEDAALGRKKIRKSTQNAGEKEGRISAELQRPRLFAEGATGGRNQVRESVQELAEPEDRPPGRWDAPPAPTEQRPRGLAEGASKGTSLLREPAQEFAGMEGRSSVALDASQAATAQQRPRLLAAHAIAGSSGIYESTQTFAEAGSQSPCPLDASVAPMALQRSCLSAKAATDGTEQSRESTHMFTKPKSRCPCALDASVGPKAQQPSWLFAEAAIDGTNGIRESTQTFTKPKSGNLRFLDASTVPMAQQRPCASAEAAGGGRKEIRRAAHRLAKAEDRPPGCCDALPAPIAQQRPGRPADVALNGKKEIRGSAQMLIEPKSRSPCVSDASQPPMARQRSKLYTVESIDGICESAQKFAEPESRSPGSSPATIDSTLRFAEDTVKRKQPAGESAQRIAETDNGSRGPSSSHTCSAITALGNADKVRDAVPAPQVPCAIQFDALWPEPFWAEGSSRTLSWKDPATGAKVRFQAMLVEPGARCDGTPMQSKDVNGLRATDREEAKPNDIHNSALPLFVYFSGLGSGGGLNNMNVARLQRSVSVPFVLLAAVRDRLPWWMLSSQSQDWGWVDGDFVSEEVEMWSNLVARILAEPSIDEDCCSLLGYSAGAYAITELVSASRARWRPRAVVLGGVHGHGQSSAEGLCSARQKKLPQIQQKWHAYIERLSTHVGVSNGIFAAHCREDKICPWNSAMQIYEALGLRQRSLGFPEVDVDEVDIGEAKHKKSKMYHNYHDRTFFREALLNKLLPTQLRSRRPKPTPPPEETSAGSETPKSAQVGTGSVAEAGLQRTAPPVQAPSARTCKSKTLSAKGSVLQQIQAPPPPPRTRSRTPRRKSQLRGSVALAVAAMQKGAGSSTN